LVAFLRHVLRVGAFKTGAPNLPRRWALAFRGSVTREFENWSRKTRGSRAALSDR